MTVRRGSRPRDAQTPQLSTDMEALARMTKDVYKRNTGLPHWARPGRPCLHSISGRPLIWSASRLPRTILAMQLLQHINPRPTEKDLLISLVPRSQRGGSGAWEGCQRVVDDVEQASDDFLQHPCCGNCKEQPGWNMRREHGREQRAGPDW